MKIHSLKISMKMKNFFELDYENFSEEVIDAKTGNVVIKLGDKINFLNAKN